MTAPPPPRKKLITSLLLAVAVLAVLWLIVAGNLTLAEMQRIAEDAAAWTAAHPITVFAAITAAHGIGMALSLPTKALLSLLAGALLGVIGGSVSTCIGVLSGTTVLFFVSRHLLRNRVAQELGGKAKQIEQRISKRPIRAMIGLRLFIVLPFGPLTVTAALSSMRYRDFLVGTVIGDIPVVILYCIAGERIFELTSASEALSPSTIAILGVIGLFFLAGALFGRKQKLSVVSKGKPG